MSGAHAAIAAAAAKRRKEQEEERMTGYSAEDLAEYEFKIVRSITNGFSDMDLFYRVLEEEALAGWEMFEKLDDGRIRFKRLTSARKRDHTLPEGYNPYRTRIGMSEGALVFWIIFACIALVIVLAIVIPAIESGRLF